MDWYPWGDAAFERARSEDKAIFLSVGYSTCHWCHVMEHESFENDEVAAALNRHFVSIKVDREERPDVDRVYMTFVQATTGSGGWPMSVWLTPTLEPFYGGTYFPPAGKWGRPGFVDVIEEIARAWRDERDKVVTSASAMLERISSFGNTDAFGRVRGIEALDRAVQEFVAAFDRRRGGFGNAPKFPRPSELLFLMREHARTGAADPRDMALLTLRAMALGGMRDHLGGGFHRYSVDGDWRVPHFEKMLYDQAQLVLAYVDATQLTGDPSYGAVAADTLEYVRRDLSDAAGGFFSAEDADSVPPEHADATSGVSGKEPHKMEGAFYIWRDDEVKALLKEDADPFRERYGILPDGNAPFDPQAEFTHKNLLHTARGIAEIASQSGRSEQDVEAAISRGRATLFVARGARPRPHLDDKVLTAWNGLSIAAFARAARVLEGAEDYLHDATRAASFLHDRLWDSSTGTLLRRYRKGDSGVPAYAEDYAYLVFGLLELFQAGGDPKWLTWALTLQQRLDEQFWDPVDGGWFSTTGKDPSVLLRLKEQYDGAEPAASSVAVLNLLTLSHLFGETRATPELPTPNTQALGVGQAVGLGVGSYVERAERTLALFGPQLGRAVPMMLVALSTYHAGMPQIVIVGDPEAADTRALFNAIRQRYMPTAVIVPVAPRYRDELVRVLSWVDGMKARDGRATAYVCRDFACQAPTQSPLELEQQLGI